MWLETLTSELLNRILARRDVATAGLSLGSDIEPPHKRVILPERHRCEHVVIVGKTGSGKTHLLELLATQIAARREGFCFLDFHGDASLSLVARLLSLPNAHQRLLVVDPSHATRSPGINVLDTSGSDTDRFRKVSEISSILRQRWGVDSFGARTEELLRNSLYTLAGASHTLADLPRLLTDAHFRRDLTRQLTNPDIEAYWRDRYEPLSEPMKGAFREPLLNRVTAFLIEPAARHLLGQTETTVDIAEAMRKRRWLIVRLPKGRLREHAHTLGNLLFAQLQFAALAREALPQRSRSTFTLLCDEVQNLAENDLATLITEGRKFGISVITANQFWEQLPRELRGCLLSAASHVCFRVSAADANVLAAEFSQERRHRLTHELTSLERGEAVGRFGSQQVVRFRVSPLPAVALATAAELEEVILPVTKPREEIEQRLRQGREPKIAPIAQMPPDTREGQYEW
jgi:energy-coupling factor transporter ATP-binding protein EcfA2